MVEANAEYKEALAQAGELGLAVLVCRSASLRHAEELLEELKKVLAVTVGDGTERNIVTDFGRSNVV